MQPDTRPAKELCALYEAVEAHALLLRHMLADHSAAGDLKPEVERLNGLLSSFTYANELMQQLLDCSNAKVNQERARGAVKVFRLRGIIEGREPLVELRDRSNRTICRTLALLKQAEQVMAQEMGDDGIYRRLPREKAFALIARA